MQSWGGGGSYDVYSLLWEWCVSWGIDIAYRDFIGCLSSSYFSTFSLALLITPQHHFSSLLISVTPFLSFYHLSLLLFLQILSNNSLFLTNLPVWRERFKEIYLLTTYASSSKVTSFSPCLSLSALLYPPNIETCANIKARATVAP